MFTPAHGLTNARITHTPDESNWQFGVWGNNLTDE